MDLKQPNIIVVYKGKIIKDSFLYLFGYKYMNYILNYTLLGMQQQ